MKNATVAYNLPSEYLDRLSSEYEIMLMPSDPCLPAQTEYHPDMNMSVIDDVIILPSSFKNIYPGFCRYYENLSYATEYTSSLRCGKYPYDSTLNCLIVGNHVICKSEYADETLKATSLRKGYDIINVNQGYAACSSIVCHDSVITSDAGIAKVLDSLGIDCLLVSYEGIRLNGYNTGFIGGAGGFNDGNLYFFGNIDTIPSGDEIRLFAYRHGFNVINLSSGPVFDYGGIKFV